MARFMDVHRGFVGITDDQLREAHAADLAIQADEGVTFERAWADPESGVIYCLSEGPDAAAVLRVHDRAGHPTDEIRPVPLEV